MQTVSQTPYALAKSVNPESTPLQVLLASLSKKPRSTGGSPVPSAGSAGPGPNSSMRDMDEFFIRHFRAGFGVDGQC